MDDLEFPIGPVLGPASSALRGQFRFFQVLSHLVIHDRVALETAPPVDRLGGRCGGVFRENRGVLTRLAAIYWKL